MAYTEEDIRAAYQAGIKAVLGQVRVYNGKELISLLMGCSSSNLDPTKVFVLPPADQLQMCSPLSADEILLSARM